MNNIRMNKYDILLLGLILSLSAFETVKAQTENNQNDFFKVLQIDSEYLNEERSVSIFLPASYESTTDAYPLLVILDGEDFFHPFSGMISYYSKIGKCPELIVVGVDSKDRWHDYTLTHANIPDGTPLPTSGGSELFYKFLKYELMEFLELKYCISPFHILFGHSIAGLFVVNNVFDKQSNYSGFIATSPSLWWDNELITKKSKAYVDSTFSHRRYLFFTIGNEGLTMLNPILNFKKSLEKYNNSELSWKFEQYEHIDHQTMPIKSFLYGLEFIFSDWQMPQNIYEEGLPAIVKYYNNLSKKYMQKIIPPENAINRLGYFALDKDNLDEAVRIFQYNIELYPKSANVYDSMAEAYLKAGDSTRAANNYKKSLELDPKNENAKRIILELETN